MSFDEVLIDIVGKLSKSQPVNAVDLEELKLEARRLKEAEMLLNSIVRLPGKFLEIDGFRIAGGDVIGDEDGIFIKNSSEAWFNFGTNTNTRGVINIANDPNNDFEFVNLARSPNGTISFFLKDTTGTTRRPLHIKEDTSDVMRVEIGIDHFFPSLDLAGSGSATVYFNERNKDIDFKIEGTTDDPGFIYDAGLNAIGIGAAASSSYKVYINGSVNLASGQDYYRNGVSLSDSFDALNGTYAPIAKGVTNGDSHDHNGGDGGTIAYSSLSGALTQAAGTYTPTLTNTTNISSSSVLGTFKYSRVGNVVTVSGGLSITPTAGGSATTTIGISLPITSNFADSRDANGNGTAFATDTTGNVVADTTNDRANMSFLSPTTSAMGWRVVFQYEVL